MRWRSCADRTASLPASDSLPLPALPAAADATVDQMEAIARLAWSDEAAREELGEQGCIAAVLGHMHAVS